MKKSRFLLLSSFFLCFGTMWAEEITGAQAVQAARVWLEQNPSPLAEALNGEPSLAQTYSNATGNAVFHVVQFSQGGYIWLAADDAAGPVLAIAPGFAGDAKAQAYAAAVEMAEGDVSAGQAAVASTRQARVATASTATTTTLTPQERWAQLLASPKLRAAPVEVVGDVRVKPFVKAKWNQSTVGGRNFFNAQTPNNYVCGCVATAGAQVMRHYEHPKSIKAFSESQCSVGGTKTTLAVTARTYNWDKMPYIPTSSFHQDQVDEVGHLVYAVGVSSRMQYKSGGSGASIYYLCEALKDKWGYASAKYKYNGSGLSSSVIKSCVLASLDCKSPVVCSIDGSSGGHAIVADGYGYQDGVLFLHLNMGWGGSSDMWYNMPNVPTTQYTFSVFDGIVYNIFPGDTGLSVLTGRLFAKDGTTPLAKATVQGVMNGKTYTATTDERGIYSFQVPMGTSGTMTVTPIYDSGKGNTFKINYDGASNSVTSDQTLSFETVNELESLLADLTNTTLKFDFDTVNGRTYYVQSSTNLTEKIWTTNQKHTATATGTKSIALTRDAKKPAQFFRIMRETEIEPEEAPANDPTYESLTWAKTTTGATPWETITGDEYEGGSALRIDLADYKKTATLSTQVEGPLLMSFDFRYCLATDSYVAVLVDGVECYRMGERSSDSGWLTATVEIPEGSHKVEIRCYRSNYYFTGSGVYDYGVTIDKLAFTSRYTKAPTIKHTAGTFTITAEDGAEIYYTYDSMPPTVDTGILYKKPFTISESALVQAIAVKKGFAPSVATQLNYTK